MTHRMQHHDEAGLVSFVVVIIVMMVLSLITLSFARLIRREQRQALDQQLSTQAFYAAESGINDARKKIDDDLAAATTSWPDYTQCNDFISAKSLDTDLDPDVTGTVISYSCLLVDPTPPSLAIDPVGTSESVIMPLQLKDTTQTITQINISWNGKDISDPAAAFANCPTPGTFPVSWGTNCPASPLRIDVVPFTTAAQRTRAQLIDNTYSFILTPNGALTTLSGANLRTNTNQGRVLGVSCVDGTGCKMRISNLSIKQGYVRIKSLYSANSVMLTPQDGSNPVELLGAQAVIDATGKANDLLKRVQVRVPLYDTDPIAEFALRATESICKRYQVIPAGGSSGSASVSVIDAASQAGLSSLPACSAS